MIVDFDSSGSISSLMICEVFKGIIPCSDEILLIVADAKIQKVVYFDKLNKFLNSYDIKEHGGTDHICVFDYIQKQRLTPRLFIGLSDLCTALPNKKPPFPVLWFIPFG